MYGPATGYPSVMWSGSHAETPTVADVVRRAVAICDPDGADEVSDDDAGRLRLAARAECGEHLPEDVSRWLQEAGVAA